MEGKKKYTLIGYADPVGKRNNKINFRFVKLIFKDENKLLFHGIYAGDNKTITFKLWNIEYVPVKSDISVSAGDMMLCGYIFNGEFAVGTDEEMVPKLLEIAKSETLNPEELFDIGLSLSNVELIVAGIKKCIETYTRWKLTYENFNIPNEEVRKAVEKRFTEKT